MQSKEMIQSRIDSLEDIRFKLLKNNDDASVFQMAFIETEIVALNWVINAK